MSQAIAKKGQVSSEQGNDHLLSSKIESSKAFKLKERLQFTGWLQFIPNAMLTLVSFVLAGLGWLVGVVPALLFWPPLVLGSLLLANLLFDVTVLKFGLRPQESLPSPRTESDAFEVMRARRSCRSFQPRKLTDEHRRALLEVAALHSRPEALLGEDRIRLEYIAAPLTVWPVLGAQEFFVAIAPKPYNRMAVLDVGRSLQEVVLHATRLGLGTCWIGPGADHRSIAAHLGEAFDPTREHIICVCAIGYASIFMPLGIRVMTLAQRRRLPLSSLFFADASFETPLDVDTPPFSDFGRCYEVCQWAPSSFNSQTTRCAAVTEERDGKTHLIGFDFAAATASRYYAPVAAGIWCTNWETGCEALGIPGTFTPQSPTEQPQGTPHIDVRWTLQQPIPLSTN